MALISALAFHAGAFAAEIESEPSKDSEVTLISIVGTLEASDVEKFRRLAVRADKALVALKSPGGSTAAAIEIGRLIRLRGYSTLVFNGTECNSACALIWLAGERRYLSQSARIGFHATYLQRDGAKVESGVGNAVVGSYLTALALPERAIVFATSAPPDRLNWLSHTNAGENGISVEKIDDLADDDESTSKDAEEFGKVGSWTILVDKSLDRGCFAYASYDNDVALRVGIDARDPIDAYIMIFGSEWKSITPEQEYKIELRFASGRKWQKTFVGTQIDELKGILLRMDDLEIIETIQRERSVSIYYRSQVVSELSLPDSKAAIERMWECQRAQRKAKDPFAN
ncbi:hypothetical protein [Phenylobacterium sp.]|uniref:hypothetical protein n=1 Tax=Phenylobacterium sp. TaxID=1871053 RepID=UPI0037C862C1